MLQTDSVKLQGYMTKRCVHVHKTTANQEYDISVCVSYFFKDFAKKCWVTALVGSMIFIGGLNQYSAAANLELTQHLLKNKNKIKCMKN